MCRDVNDAVAIIKKAGKTLVISVGRKQPDILNNQGWSYVLQDAEKISVADDAFSKSFPHIPESFVPLKLSQHRSKSGGVLNLKMISN